MYALAKEISSESEDPGVRRAAARVVQILEPVIDLPLATAKQLQEGRRRFGVLVNVLGDVRENGNKLPLSSVVAPHDIMKRVNHVKQERVAHRIAPKSPADRNMKFVTRQTRKTFQRTR